MFTKPFRRIASNVERIRRLIDKKYNYVVFYGSSFSDLDIDHYKLILKVDNIRKYFFVIRNMTVMIGELNLSIMFTILLKNYFLDNFIVYMKKKIFLK